MVQIENKNTVQNSPEKLDLENADVNPNMQSLREQARTTQASQSAGLGQEVSVDYVKEVFEGIAANSGGTVKWGKDATTGTLREVVVKDDRVIASRDPLTKDTLIHEKGGAIVSINAKGDVAYQQPPGGPLQVADAAVTMDKEGRILGLVPIHRTACVGSGQKWECWGFNPNQELTTGNRAVVPGRVDHEGAYNGPAHGDPVTWYLKTTPQEDARIKQAVATRLLPAWNGTEYSLATRNCGNFTDAFRGIVQEVTGRSMQRMPSNSSGRPALGY